MVRLDKIRIGDARRLRESGLVSGSIASIEDEIRSFIDFRQINVLVAYEEDVPIALIKIHLLDRKNCRVLLNIVIEEILSDDVTYELIDKITYYCLVEQAYHKVTVTISSGNMYMEEPCTAIGYIQESVLADEIDNNGLYEDAGLFRVLSGDYRNYNCCFVPFEMGVAVITGSRDHIDGIKLYRFGDRLGKGFVLNVAKQLRLVDREGCFLDNSDGKYDMVEEELDMLPAEVSKAFYQVSNYFSKTSSSFDLNLNLDKGTEFQKSVWAQLSGVRYGSTKSYEDIALLISGGDIRKAKNLTRAVGNACSENPIMLAVPCHRIIGKDGKLAGFSAGVEVQDYLLTLEAFTYVTSIK